LEKDDLKSLITQVYNELLKNINSQKKPNKEEIVSYLREAALTIESISDEEIDSVEHARLAFTNAYKTIADRSISSYKKTNGTFEKLTKLHQETLNNCKSNLIDLPSISEKFNEIQEHMQEEVIRANNIITNLSRQIKELEENTQLDTLTKVFNRRAMDTYLDKVCSKGNLKHELHMLILDIDDFKSVNDTYGHIAGDKVLILIANTLRKTLRDGDKIFRYGGEEFVIVLNRISKEKCKIIAKRIIAIINANQLIYKGQYLHVTVSIGATPYYDGDAPEALVYRADKALYISKKNGKNQMTVEEA